MKQLFRLRSARATLAVIGVLATVVVMALLGLGAYGLTEQRFRMQRDEAWEALQRHLGPPVAKALWVYDRQGLQAALQAELGGPVLGVTVRDPAGRPVAQAGVATAASVTEPTDTLVLDIPSVESQRLGQIEVIWSDRALRLALRDTLWLMVAQTIGVCVVLLTVIWFGVDRLIFRRVARLQAALDTAAARDMSSDIVPLQHTTYDEFDAITASINAIILRLGAELEAGRESEEEARAALNNLQNAQEGLVRAEKMAALGRLVAGVSHELNTPIGNMVTVASTQSEVADRLAQAVADGALTRSSLQDYANKIHEGAELLLGSARRSAELIQNFKQVAVDQTTDQLRDFDLARQMAEVLSVIAHVVAKTQIELVLDLPPGIRMHSYPGPLGQVLTNLVMNAFVHGFDGGQQPGTIAVSCQQVGDAARIVVRDNGTGIPPEDIDKIFDPFFTTRLGQGGTGLGLHICHNLVYGPLRGSLRVDSKPGQGAAFTVQVPCVIAG
jgi:signal transduction histidine kinase